MTDPWALPQVAAPAAPSGLPLGAVDPAAPPDQSERFPMGSEAGWRPDPTVPGQLRLWDGRHWTEHTRPLDAAAEAIRQAPTIRTNNAVRAWSLMAQLTLALAVVTSCLLLLWVILTLNTLDVWALQPGDVHEADARKTLQSLILLVGAQILVHMVSVVVLLVWVGVARTDRHLNARLLRGSTVGSVIGWVVPFLRIRTARRTLTDLWQASDPTRADDGPLTASRATPPLVLAYLLLRFAAPVLGILAVGRVRSALGTVDQVRDFLHAVIFFSGAHIAATVCLIVIITKVTDQLRGRETAPGSRAVSPISASFTRS